MPHMIGSIMAAKLMEESMSGTTSTCAFAANGAKAAATAGAITSEEERAAGAETKADGAAIKATRAKRARESTPLRDLAMTLRKIGGLEVPNKAGKGNWSYNLQAAHKKA
mmetsp:Transcript_34455/g.80568  ORF Transcript_34455/g.80568 Transcript_34455/m.80568 type:complete len:110 (-) Transcript_34455:3-332(-)